MEQHYRLYRCQAATGAALGSIAASCSMERHWYLYCCHFISEVALESVSLTADQ